tara:strand:- start:1272 stop:1544 length:273 start_codon:yes stop_codon:yes gene_type:complete
MSSDLPKALNIDIKASILKAEAAGAITPKTPEEEIRRIIMDPKYRVRKGGPRGPGNKAYGGRAKKKMAYGGKTMKKYAKGGGIRKAQTYG